MVSAALAVLVLISTTLVWRLASGPGWAPLVCVLLVAAVVAQLAAGYSRSLALHIPLGVAIIVTATMLLVWAWRVPSTTGELITSDQPAMSPLSRRRVLLAAGGGGLLASTGGLVSLAPGADRDPGQTVLVRFTDYPGRFLLHCHNLEHEDMAMMSTFTVT